jgi:hypothetical protein
MSHSSSILTVATRKSPSKITLLEAQRRRLEALDRWFQFINNERVITPENFSNELLFPTVWGLGRKAGYGLSGWVTPAEIEEIRMEISEGLKALADNREWIIPVAKLGHFNIVISELGVSYEGGLQAQALLGVSSLLDLDAWRSTRCSWCGKPFLKKKRGEYCSLNCSQRMRTKRARDPLWRKDEKRARRLGFTVNELRTALERPCPKCGVINLTPLEQLVVRCRKCTEIFPALFPAKPAAATTPQLKGK